MKNFIKNLSLTLIILIVGLGLFGEVNAAEEYTLLAPLPGTTLVDGCTDKECKSDLQTYLPGIFKLSIGIAAALAFIMITFGGVTYAVSDSITGKNDGKKWIENALWGLLLVIGAYTILYTINPQILNFNLTINRPVIEAVNSIEATGGVLPGYKLTDEEVAENNRIRQELQSKNNILVNAGPCITAEVTRGCTNLVRLPGSALVGVVNLKESCGCSITISGGAEGGHKTHGPGKAVLDLRTDPSSGGLDSYIIKNAVGPVLETSVGKRYSVRIGGGAGATFLRESNPDHWHVQF